MKAEFDEALLLVNVQLPKDLGRVEQVLVFEDSATALANRLLSPSVSIHPADSSHSEYVSIHLLLRIPSHQRQVQDQRQPVSVDQEEHSQESVDAGFGDDVHVEAVAEVDRVDVVAFEVGVHDREEDLQEEVDGIEKDGEEKEPVQIFWSASVSLLKAMSL